ncbi:hypothetical protein HK103_000876 [Boothiomyces macroporosus]|uniref:RNA helicase n=1 Tax=Boothiomyces macroporosus TaxID=261099 RepID=A0AAD5UP84_9FUNG|nr:hypothetical protein HK103_000876 [Boothiomyces macroporosus]
MSNRYQPYSNSGRNNSYGSRGSYGRGRGNGRGGFGGGNRQFNDVQHVYEENPVWNSENCPPFEKKFYVEHEETAKLTESEIDQFRREHQMTLTGSNIPRPIMKFTHSQWPTAIRNLFEKNGFENPTPIQSQGWPMALTGRNMCGIAQTGSGKTLSFILPAIIHILGQPQLQRGDGPIALVLAPTRELAVQIQSVAAEYGAPVDVRNSCLYGGASKGPQIGELNRTPHIVIATPGRLLDLLQLGKTTLKRVTYLVLDEADRMLDMGFEQDLRKIMAQIRPDRQLLLWSATWPKSVQRLARDFLSDDHIKVQIGSQKLQANKNINQHVRVISESEKEDALCKLLVDIWNKIPGPDDSKKMERTIIFTNKKYQCENINNRLWNENWSSVTIHGDKTQQERDRALADFKSGYSPILIATDVAARGLDVKELLHVVNFDFPNNIEDFVHRIGRTARGKSSEGNSYTFFTTMKQDRANAQALVDLMQDAGQEVPQELQDLAYQANAGRNAGRGGSRWGGRGGRGGNGRGRGREFNIEMDTHPQVLRDSINKTHSAEALGSVPVNILPKEAPHLDCYPAIVKEIVNHGTEQEKEALHAMETQK